MTIWRIRLARVKHFPRLFWLLWQGRTCLTGRSRPMQVWRGKMGRRRLLRGALHRRAQAASFYSAHWAGSIGKDVLVIRHRIHVVTRLAGPRPGGKGFLVLIALKNPQFQKRDWVAGGRIGIRTAPRAEFLIPHRGKVSGKVSKGVLTFDIKL